MNLITVQAAPSAEISPPLVRGIGLAIVVAAAVKLLVAGQLELFQDEAFYWLESRRLAPSFSDMPPLTAMMIRLGTEIFGQTPLAARAFFWLAGALTPVAVHWLARPLVGRRDALLAAGASLMVPLLFPVGVLAVPDSLLIFLNLVALGAFERATRTGALRYWWVMGAAMALAFLTHYRFAPFALAAAVYLFAWRPGRRWLATPGPYVAAAVAVLGLVPVAYYSFSHGHGALAYQFVERHPWRFEFDSLLFTLEQALLLTPLVFGFLIAAWFSLLRASRAGDDRRFLLWLFATLQAGVYFALSPFTDQGRVSYHWPLGGYLPLLVVLPEVLRAARTWLSRLTVITGAAGSLAVAGVLAVQGFYGSLYPRWPAMVFPGNSNFVGWRAMAQRAESLLEEIENEAPHLLVGDHYVVAAQLEFFTGREAYSIDPVKPRDDGRSIQLRLWQKDEAALVTRAGEDALVVYLAAERGKYSAPKHAAELERLCGIFASVELIDEFDLWGGVKSFQYYLARGVGEGPAAECPNPEGER